MRPPSEAPGWWSGRCSGELRKSAVTRAFSRRAADSPERGGAFVALCRGSSVTGHGLIVHYSGSVLWP